MENSIPSNKNIHPFQCAENNNDNCCRCHPSPDVRAHSDPSQQQRIVYSGGKRTSSRTWTSSDHPLSLEVASGHDQEQLHCRSLTLSPCQSLGRGRRGHAVRAFERSMREELPLQKKFSTASRQHFLPCTMQNCGSNIIFLLLIQISLCTRASGLCM